MYFEAAGNVRLVLPRRALVTIFDECDRYEKDETGGRVLGTYTDREGGLSIDVKGLIGPGSRARRSATSFYQDGEEQEHIFRQIEQRHPEIEHLGNWHTHHVNGLATLSNGDITTYQRIVNHKQHNTSFFYALLVVAKHRSGASHERYSVKHYVLRRGDRQVYEIPSSRIELTDTPLIFPAIDQVSVSDSLTTSKLKSVAKPERAYDRDIIREFYPGIQPYTSARLGVYWRGPIELIDGVSVEVVVLESNSSTPMTYSVALRNPPIPLKATAEELAQHEFPSARAAMLVTERICNRVLYDHLRVGKAQEKAPEEMP